MSAGVCCDLQACVAIVGLCAHRAETGSAFVYCLVVINPDIYTSLSVSECRGGLYGMNSRETQLEPFALLVSVLRARSCL